MASDETATGTPAYIPWRTFTNTLDALAKHMPNRIDRSAFPGQSGAGQNQLLTAFRFFGLISEEDGKPTPVLLAIAVTDEAARKRELRKLVEEKYADLFALNLMKTTPSELAEQMTKSYNITGDTRLKATRFFMAATAYLDVQVSPLLLRDKMRQAGNGSAPRKRRVSRIRTDDGDDMVDEGTDEQAPSSLGESRTVALQSGGTLTLSASTKFMSLSASDRNFVFELIDKLAEYETKNTKGEA